MKSLPGLRLDADLRLATYLTLTLACLCLGVAEQLFLPEVFWFVVPVLAALAFAWYAEGRWTLPVWAANVLGAVIAVGWIAWVAFRLLTERDPWLQMVPLPTALLPEVGPLLLLLVPVKALAAKQARDHWQLQGLGLLTVGLGCVLAGEVVFGLLLAAYAVCGLWWLMRFQARTGEGMGKERAASRVGSVLAGLAKAAGWVVVVGALAQGLFLLLPHQGPQWNPFVLFTTAQAQAQTGSSGQIDLNRTGVVEISEELALTVAAEDAAGNPKSDLGGDQRWRGAVLDFYQQGRWASGYLAPFPSLAGPAAGGARPEATLAPEGGAEGRPPPTAGATAPRMPVAEPGPRGSGSAEPGGPGLRPPGEAADPVGQDQGFDLPGLVIGPGMQLPRTNLGRQLYDLGDRQFFLTFTVEPRKAGGVFLAEPIPLRHDLAGSPVVGLQPKDRQGPLFQEFQGTLVPASSLGRSELRYRQVAVPPDEPDLGPPLAALAGGYLRYLLQQPLPPLAPWTKQLLQHLATDPNYALTAADVELQPAPPALREQGQVEILPPERWERAAAALTKYLAQSGQYTYTLDLRRSDPRLDPTLDFLWNVKAGHCERYAGALALMLRSVGVPARVVKGFRGGENQGDGTVTIRQSHAHSWVEVLVMRTGPDGRRTVHWRSFDPTPATDAVPSASALLHWWEEAQRLAQTYWQDFLLEYNADQQAELGSGLGRWLTAALRGGGAAGVGGLPGGLWAVVGISLGVLLAGVTAVWGVRRAWRRGRRAAARAPALPAYARLLAILARRGLRPGHAQTPREFGEAAGAVLRVGDATAGLAQVPARVVTLLYRVRFGGEPLPPDEARAAGADLDRLDAALAGR